MAKQRFIKKANEIKGYLKKNEGIYFINDQLYVETTLHQHPPLTFRQFIFIMRIVQGDKHVKKIIIGNATMFGYFYRV